MEDQENLFSGVNSAEDAEGKARRISILKLKPKKTDSEELNADITNKSIRRVSFASSNFVKPFTLDPEKNTVWDSTYEEEINQTDSMKSNSARTDVFNTTLCILPDMGACALDTSERVRVGLSEEKCVMNNEKLFVSTSEIARTTGPFEITETRLFQSVYTECTGQSDCDIELATTLASGQIIERTRNADDEPVAKNKTVYFDSSQCDIEFTAVLPVNPIIEFETRTGILNRTVCFDHSEADMEFTSVLPAVLPELKVDRSEAEMEFTSTCVPPGTNIVCAEPTEQTNNQKEIGADIENCGLSERNRPRKGILKDRTVCFDQSDADMEFTSVLPTVPSEINTSKLVREPINDHAEAEMELTDTLIPPGKDILCVQADKQMGYQNEADADKENWGSSRRRTIHFRSVEDDMEITSPLPRVAGIGQNAMTYKDTNMSGDSKTEAVSVKPLEIVASCTSNVTVESTEETREKQESFGCSKRRRTVHLKSEDHLELTLAKVSRIAKNLNTDEAGKSKRTFHRSPKPPEESLGVEGTKTDDGMNVVSNTDRPKGTGEDEFGAAQRATNFEEASGSTEHLKSPGRVAASATTHSSNESKEIAAASELAKRSLDSGRNEGHKYLEQVKDADKTQIEPRSPSRIPVKTLTKSPGDVESSKAEKASASFYEPMDCESFNEISTKNMETGVLDTIEPDPRKVAAPTITPLPSFCGGGNSKIVNAAPRKKAESFALLDKDAIDKSCVIASASQESDSENIAVIKPLSNISHDEPTNAKIVSRKPNCRLEVEQSAQTPSSSFIICYSNFSPVMADNTQQLIQATFSTPESFEIPPVECTDRANTSCCLVNSFEGDKKDQDMELPSMMLESSPDHYNYTHRSGSLLENAMKFLEIRPPKDTSRKERINRMYEQVIENNKRIEKLVKNLRLPDVEIVDFRAKFQAIKDKYVRKEAEINEVDEVKKLIPRTIQERVCEASERVENQWKLEHVSKDGLFYFTSMYGTVPFEVKVHPELGIVFGIKTYWNVKADAENYVVYMAKVLQLKMEWDNLLLVLGEKFDLLTLLDYITMSVDEIMGFNRGHLQLVKKYRRSHGFTFNPDFSISFHIINGTVIAWWVISVQLSMSNVGCFEGLSVAHKVGEKVNEERIRAIAENLPAGGNFFEALIEEVEKYVWKIGRKLKVQK